MARKRISIPNKTLKEIIKRDGTADCFYCHKPGKMNFYKGSKGKGNWLTVEHEVDHIVPLSKGGTNELKNLVIACKECNRKKGDKVDWEHGTTKDD